MVCRAAKAKWLATAEGGGIVEEEESQELRPENFADGMAVVLISREGKDSAFGAYCAR